MQYSAAGVPKLLLCWNLLRRKILKAIVTIWIYLILQIALVHENHVLQQAFQTVALVTLWLCRSYKSLSLLRCITFNSLSLLLSGWWCSLCKICKGPQKPSVVRECSFGINFQDRLGKFGFWLLLGILQVFTPHLEINPFTDSDTSFLHVQINRLQ